MRDVSILTDTRIAQSPLWSAKTDVIQNEYFKETNTASKLPLRLRSVLLPFFNLYQILKNLDKYEVVITGNIRTAQLLGLFRSIFHVQSPKHIVLELMLDEEQKNLMWRIKRAMQQRAFSSVDVIFVSATNEIETYAKRLNKPVENIRFLPFHTNIIKPRMMKTGSYILSAGRTGRDFKVLAAAVKDLNIKVVVVGEEYNLKNIDFPPNVTVFQNLPYPKYLELLNQSRFVVVTLKRLIKSTGQVAILEAMASGKAVIATDTVGTRDYIQSGTNGILVPTEDPQTLRQAIENLLNNAEIEKKISRAAFERVLNFHTFEKYCGAILTVAEELSQSVPRQRKRIAAEN